MMQREHDMWREVLSVDWPVKRRWVAERVQQVSPQRASTHSSFLWGLKPILCRALPIDTRVVIALTGPGGGTWTLDHTSMGPRVIEGASPWYDSRMQCPSDRFLDLLDADLDPADVLAQSDFEIDGDVGLLLRLRAAWIADCR
jgi:hypothetical protein